MRISDWSSDVCSSDLLAGADLSGATLIKAHGGRADFTGAVLKGADLGKAEMARADFTGADFTGANLQKAERGRAILEIGRAPCRGRECQYVENSLVAVALKKKNPKNKPHQPKT